jgi:hypothetical protein
MTTAITIGAILIGLLLLRLISKKTVDKKQTEIIKVTLTTQNFVDKYNKKQGLFKGGSLCFFGHWFGKPYDNYHQLEYATFDSSTNELILIFNEKETLTIFNPQDITESESQLTIGLADKICWKWFSYGKPQTGDNLYFIEITRQDNKLTGNSNVNWYKPDFKDLNIIKPALLWT